MIFNMVGGSGSGESLIITDTPDEHGGIIRTITGKVVKLQTKTITPSSTQQIVDPDTGYDGFSQVTVEAGGADIPTFTASIDEQTEEIVITCDWTYAECLALLDYDNPNRNASALLNAMGDWYGLTGYAYANYVQYACCDFDNRPMLQIDYASNGTITYIEPSVPISLQTKSVTPTESTQVVTADSDYDGLDEVDVEAISSTYVGSGITRRSSTDLTVSSATVTVPSGYYSSQATKSVASGTAGTPTATKGTVSNHSISVTPSVTNTTGYITGSTKTGTAVSVSASELVSGSETKTANGTYDVTNLAEVVVDVQGGGSSGVQVAIATPASGANDYVMFDGLLGAPTSFSLINAHDIAIGTDHIVSALTYDGTDYVGQTITNTSNANASYVSTGFSHSYNNQYGSIIISNENVKFDTFSNYSLIYTYGGSASDIHTADAQVGSGATSITFSSLSGRPIYWSCVFKSNFGTSSGYQRVIAVTEYDSAIGGLCLDSSAHASNQYWTASYSGGNLTISSQGTNAGGYFHQPGYYQLTYAIDDSAPVYQTKTVSPTTSQQTVTPDSGYDALEEVVVNAMPTMTLPSATSATSSGTSKATITPSSSAQYLNIPTGYNGTAQYYTISASGGGSSKNTQTAQSTTRATSTSYTEVISLTCTKAGTYDVYWSTFRSSTSGTWGSQLYINDTAHGSAQTGSWSNHIQNIHLSNVTIAANADVAVRVRSRGSNYYGYVGTLTIIES